MFTWVKGFEYQCECGEVIKEWQSKTASIAGHNLWGDTININETGIGTIFYNSCYKCHKSYQFQVKIVQETYSLEKEDGCVVHLFNNAKPQGTVKIVDRDNNQLYFE